jgi:hypothetical protein
MYSSQSAGELAARVRSLIGPADQDRWRELAEELSVPTTDLREIVEHATPYPSVAVLSAIVAYYGVDAGWLLTGEYSPALHRADEESAQPSKKRVTQLLRDEAATIAGETGESARVKLAELLRENPGGSEFGV